MNAQEYRERTLELEGWPVRVTTYRLDGLYHSKADNVDPGASLARSTGSTREEAEAEALEKARIRLARTRRHPI
jgi:hypothetical protein